MTVRAVYDGADPDAQHIAELLDAISRMARDVLTPRAVADICELIDGPQRVVGARRPVAPAFSLGSIGKRSDHGHAGGAGPR